MTGWYLAHSDAVSRSQSSQALCFLTCSRQQPHVPNWLSHLGFLVSSENGDGSDGPSLPGVTHPKTLFLRSHEPVLSMLPAQLMWL